MDCKVLMDGYEVFRGWILEHAELDVDSYITILSLASVLMLKSGCYDNVFHISGVLQQYISRCVVGGGAVMCNSNKMYHVKQKIADVDACTLYPGACIFMAGFLKGLPKALNSQDVYVIRVKYVNLNKRLEFPLASRIDQQDGVRNFTNKMEHVITYMYIYVYIYMLAKYFRIFDYIS